MAMTSDEARKAAEELVSAWGRSWRRRTFVSAIDLGHLDAAVEVALYAAYQQGVTDGEATQSETPQA